MTYEVALLTFGVILLLLRLVGRVKAKEIDVGTSSAIARLTVGIIGGFRPDIKRTTTSRVSD